HLTGMRMCTNLLHSRARQDGVLSQYAATRLSAGRFCLTEHWAEARLDGVGDRDVPGLVEVRAVDRAVQGDPVEIEQLAAERAAHLRVRGRELVPAERRRADDEDLRCASIRPGLRRARRLDEPADRV